MTMALQRLRKKCALLDLVNWSCQRLNLGSFACKAYVVVFSSKLQSFYDQGADYTCQNADFWATVICTFTSELMALTSEINIALL